MRCSSQHSTRLRQQALVTSSELSLDSSILVLLELLRTAWAGAVCAVSLLGERAPPVGGGRAVEGARQAAQPEPQGPGQPGPQHGLLRRGPQGALAWRAGRLQLTPPSDGDGEARLHVMAVRPSLPGTFEARKAPQKVGCFLRRAHGGRARRLRGARARRRSRRAARRRWGWARLRSGRARRRWCSSSRWRLCCRRARALAMVRVSAGSRRLR